VIGVADQNPRAFTAAHAWSLRALSHQVVTQIELGASLDELSSALDACTRGEAMSQEIVEKYRLLVESIGDGVFVARGQEFLFSNRALAQMLGYTAEEFRMLDFAKVVAAGSLDAWQKHCQTVGTRGMRPCNEVCEVQLLRADNAAILAELRTQAVVFEGTAATLGIVRNITDQKKAELALRESESRFRLLADHAPVLVWMADVASACTYFSRPWLEFTGRSLTEELGDGWTAGIHPDDVGYVLETYLKAFGRRASFEVEYRLRRHDGAYRWMLVCISPQSCHRFRLKPATQFAGNLPPISREACQ
jgi:hypothetical protein